MIPVQAAVSGRKFFVIVAGVTNGAHRKIVDDVRSCGQVEVDFINDSDYLLVFCPVASRTETDINEALSKAPAGKSTILVVMHHTFNRDYVVAESRRLVHDPKVILTVDYLFYEGKLLHSTRNEISLHEIKKVLGVPVSQDTLMQTCITGLQKHRWIILFTILAVLGILACVIFCVLYFTE